MRESNRARQAFEDYYALGPGRSLADLLDQYRVQSESKPSPPTRRLGSLKAWSATFGWQARVAQRDEALAAAAAARLEAERLRVFNEGFAQMHQRVEALNRLARRMLEELERPPSLGTPPSGDEPGTPGDPGGLWVHDVKQIGGGDAAREVDIWRPNGTLLEQFRGALDDIALELGGRVRGVEVSGKGGGPVQVSYIEVVAPALSDAAGEQPAADPTGAGSAA
ncbi:MAG: hypothetical protein IT318_24850 [Anaerolineales bacterium]|nr:hypothetical protein [Anaerolineales bacterium]